MRRTFPRAIIAPFLLTLAVCAPRPVTRSVIPPAAGPVAKATSDTVAYMVDFESRDARDAFVHDFEKFLKRYPFEKTLLDSASHHAIVKLSPAPEELERQSKPVAEGTGESRGLPSQEGESAVVPFLPRPDTAGSAIVYCPREFDASEFAALADAFPFAASDTVCTDTTVLCDGNAPGMAAYLTATIAGRSKIAIALSDHLINTAGQHLSAFDLVQAWTDFCTRHPAEGLAMFRFVKGMVPFIQGREAVIAGLVVSDQRTITMQLDQPDTSAIARLATRRLLPGLLGLGPYAMRSGAPGQTVLPANRRFPGGRPFLNECIMVTAADRNPLLSFSLRKLDVIPLFGRKDLDYARAKMSGQGRLVPMARDRYFLSINLAAADQRRFIATAIDPRDLLVNFVKSDGAIIEAIESDSNIAVVPVKDAAAPPPGPVTIVYRGDDAVSALIGQKLLAALSSRSVACDLKALNVAEYEKAMISHAYTVAVGWAKASVKTDPAERLRLATIWFGDNADETRRIAAFFEKPLFAVQEYVLCRNTVAFFGSRLSGISLNKGQ